MVLDALVFKHKLLLKQTSCDALVMFPFVVTRVVCLGTLSKKNRLSVNSQKTWRKSYQHESDYDFYSLVLRLKGGRAGTFLKRRKVMSI